MKKLRLLVYLYVAAMAGEDLFGEGYDFSAETFAADVGSVGSGVAFTYSGFANARVGIAVFRDEFGNAVFNARVVIKPPETTESCGKVFWILKELFYKLEFAKNYSLDDWCRKNRTRMQQQLEAFEVEDAGFIPSQAMYKASVGKGDAIDVAVLHRDHFTEVLVSSDWMFAFLHLVANTSVGKQRGSSRTILKAILRTLPQEIEVLIARGEDLPTCDADVSLEGCRHMRRLEKTMVNGFGLRWDRNAVHEFFLEVERGPPCNRVEALAFQVFHQVVELLDALADSAHFGDVGPGTEVLVGAKRARRLGGYTLVPQGLVIEKGKDGTKILVAGGTRDTTAYLHERLFMANYAHGVAEQVGARKAFAICVDASSVSGKDKLTIGVYWHQIPYTAWAPPQE